MTELVIPEFRCNTRIWLKLLSMISYIQSSLFYLGRILGSLQCAVNRLSLHNLQTFQNNRYRLVSEHIENYPRLFIQYYNHLPIIYPFTIRCRPSHLTTWILYTAVLTLESMKHLARTLVTGQECVTMDIFNIIRGQPSLFSLLNVTLDVSLSIMQMS